MLSKRRIKPFSRKQRQQLLQHQLHLLSELAITFRFKTPQIVNGPNHQQLHSKRSKTYNFPYELLNLCLQFLPAYPFLFTYQRVSKAFSATIVHLVYPTVTTLDLLRMDMRYTQYDYPSEKIADKRTKLNEALPNVNHAIIAMEGLDYLHMFPKLETLTIVATKYSELQLTKQANSKVKTINLYNYNATKYSDGFRYTVAPKPTLKRYFAQLARINYYNCIDCNTKLDQHDGVYEQFMYKTINMDEPVSVMEYMKFHVSK